MRTSYLRISGRLGSVLLAMVLAGTTLSAAGQETAVEPKPAAGQQVKKFRGRLPNHYRQVVDRKQRETIYKIQEEYASKIADLKAQLAAVTKERDEKVTAVLTAEQLEKVDQLKAEAEQKRKKPAEKAPAKPAAANP